ncbi:unnamed protein product [Heligmosomoides polygyrus]|uniref:Type III effector n=1 Tax=Heligmosomoides polygyrus TaxID=6339 RepID=A0A183F9R9_HELPZ|nr:unnamed protein product [Heligmosomoides polygyrus]
MTVSTRSAARSSSSADSSSPPSVPGAVAPQPDHCVGTPLESAGEIDYCRHFTAPLDDSLSRLDDSTLLQVKDAKSLRDAASRAILQAWSDARSQTLALARRIDKAAVSINSL